VNASVNLTAQEGPEPVAAPVLHVPDELAPAAGEAAVLSMLTVRDGASWALVSRSLLTVPSAVAGMSWKRWSERQPYAQVTPPHAGLLDLGPIFCAEPFAGVRAVRAIIDPGNWRALVESMGDGRIDGSSCPCAVAITASTSTVLLGQQGTGAAYEVVAGAKRPVLGVVATLEERELPATSDTWELVTPPNLRPGPR
jgi:hypothetical protein